MVSVYDIKPGFQALLRPGVKALARIGATANQVTVAAALLSIGVGTAMAVWHGARWPLMLVPGTLLLRMALNAVDGMLAREHNQKTRVGAVLNEVGDVVSDAALYLPLALWPDVCVWGIVGCVIGAILTEFVGVLGTTIGGGRRYDGPMGKSDRALIFSLIAIGMAVPQFRYEVWVNWTLGVMGALLMVTIWNRARKALAEGAK